MPLQAFCYTDQLYQFAALSSIGGYKLKISTQSYISLFNLSSLCSFYTFYLDFLG